MQAIALRPGRSQLFAQLAALAVMCAVMLFEPLLCLPVALLAPLFVCPLIGNKRQWWAFALALAPTALALANGGEPLFCASLLLPCLLCGAVTFMQRRKNTKSLHNPCVWYIIAYAVSLSALLVFGARALGGDLRNGLARLAIDTVNSSENPGLLLYRLAAAGVIRVPSDYRSASLISFVLDPVLRSELNLSLRLTVNSLISALAPKLFVECCLVLGLFVFLREQRLNHSVLLVKTDESGKPSAVVAPSVGAAGFSALALPKAMHLAAAILGLACLLFRNSENGFAAMISMLCGYVFECVFSLVGAAVLVGVLSSKKPERKRLYGVLAAAAYITVPMLLMTVGVLDLFMHFRSKKTTDKEEE